MTYATTTYRLMTAPTDVQPMGWTHEILVIAPDGSEVHSKLYRSLKSARADLTRRLNVAIQAGHDVVGVDATSPDSISGIVV